MAFGQSIRFAKAFVEVGLDATESAKALRKFRNQMRSLRRIGVGVGTAVAAGLTPVVALFTKATIEAAKFQESLSRFNQEFKQLAPQMRRFTDEMVNGLGQSRQQITDMMSGFNAMLRRGGQDSAAQLSKVLTKLAVDMGSFFNRDVVDVQRDLLSALAGSSETMEKYGVNVKQAAINQELLNNEIDPKRATEFQKSLARINIIMRETATAQGDAARTQGSLTNQWRRAQNELRNALLDLGNEMIPSVTQAMNEINRALREMKPLLKDVALIAGQLAKELAGRGEVFGSSELAKLNRAIGARETYGEIGARILSIGGVLGAQAAGGFGKGMFTSTADLRRQAGRLIADQSTITDLAAIAGGIGQGATEPQAGATPSLAGTLAQTRGRQQFTDLINRQAARGFRMFGRGVGAAASGVIGGRQRAVLDGVRQLVKSRTGIKSSHEIFSQAAFGGDFIKQGTVVKDTQRELLDVQKDMLDYIKNNSVVFG